LCPGARKPSIADHVKPISNPPPHASEFCNTVTSKSSVGSFVTA
jgi:hypothetical protein